MTARTFPAFPPRRGAVRGETWWGRAWTRAMEDTSLDQGRLTRGRTYARTGRVGPITVSPGRIAAAVTGSDPEPYQSTVFVERLSDAGWQRFFDEVAARSGHIAALLDGTMPHDLVEAAADAGVRLLPTVGDLEPDCTCLDWGYPCKHAAALCYQTAWLLDQDPFVLLLMRGRGEAEVLDALRDRQAAPESVPATEAYRAVPAPLPEAPPVPTGPLVAPEFPAAEGVDPGVLRLLVLNAANRAQGLLAGSAPDLTAHQDRVRIAATFPDAETPDVAREVEAWRQGGRYGLSTLEEPWTPPARDLARARAALADGADQRTELREWRNRWTVAGRGVQLRYGRDGRWYPYRKRDGEWWPAGEPDRDPVTVLSDLLAE